MTPSDASYALLSGPPIPAQIPVLEDIIRPFAVTGRGVAFLDHDGRLELSYRELAERTACAAARLRSSGVTAGALVATTVRNDLPSVLAVLATWALGGTVVSLPPAPRADRGWHARQFRPVLETMGCAFLVADEEPGEESPASASRRTIPKQALAEPEPGHVAMPDAALPATALIQFTSGSVGAPKGVAISGRALAGNIAAMIAAGDYQSETDKIASWLPLYHDMGLVAMFLTGLAARMDQVISQPADFATRPASWLTMLARERATLTAAPNFAYRLAAAVPYSEGLDLSSVRISISGGERLEWQTLLDFHAAAGPMGFDWGAIVPCYGLAEGVVAVSTTPVGRGPLQGPAGHVSSGRPMRGAQVRVPAGSSSGPVQLRGDWLFSGYHTKDGFQPVPSDDWFDTGDAGFVHDGELYVLGRRNEVLSTAGRNVFAEDVESVTYEACGQLVRTCAAFRNSAVAGRFGLVAEADPRRVRGLDAARELARLIQSSVSETLGTRLTPVLVTRLGSIPRTTSGKVQRSQCRSLYHAGEMARRLLAEVA